jgi:hypothetical protein
MSQRRKIEVKTMHRKAWKYLNQIFPILSRLSYQNSAIGLTLQKLLMATNF